MLFGQGQAFSQDNLFKGKTVGIYFSKKGFDYSGNYAIPLTQFLKTHRGKEAVVEDLKLESIIAMGQKLSGQFAGATGADSAYFLNENPVLGREFIRAFRSQSDTLDSLGPGFNHTDLILVVNPIMLGSRKNPVVYVRSNRIINKQEIVLNGRMMFSVFDAKTGLKVAWAEGCADEKETHMKVPDFHFYPQDSETGRFLGLLFSQTYRNLLAGVVSNCGTDF